MTTALVVQRFLTPLAALAFGFGAIPVSAQGNLSSDPVTAQAEDEIIVEGQTRKSLADLLEATIAPARRDQIGRFENRICPLILGLPADFKKTVEARIRENVERVGLKNAKEGCSPNLVGIVMADPQKLIPALYDSAPGLFGEMLDSQIDTLAAGDGPSYAWQIVGTRDSYGVDLENEGSPNEVLTVRNARASRIVENIQKHFETSFVLVDVTALNRVSLTQLADFLTVRSLASIRDEATKGTNANSILTLFQDRADGVQPQPEISQTDLAMLEALYSTNSNVKAWRQRSAMTRKMIANIDPAEGQKTDKDE